MNTALQESNRCQLPTHSNTYDILLERFISSQDIADSSRATYRRALQHFFQWISRQSIQNATRKDILAYKDYLRDSDLSAYTISNYLTAVRRFFAWAEGERLFPNIARDIKGAKRKKGFKKEALTVSQVKELLNSIDRSDVQGKRDYALVNLLVRCALRTIEVVRANIGDISQESGEAILYIQGKGSDDCDAFVLLTPDTLKPIMDYLSYRKDKEDSDPLFTSLSNRNAGKRLDTRTIRGIVKSCLRNIGIDSNRLTAHSCRHTGITLALLGGSTLQEAQQLARHADINTTTIYAHNIDRLTNAAERKIDRILMQNEA
ncbi:tyrosine-type recombinase/integrase [candidate division KSB1 bacterium]